MNLQTHSLSPENLEETISDLSEALCEAISEIRSLTIEIRTLRHEVDQVKLEQKRTRSTPLKPSATAVSSSPASSVHSLHKKMTPEKRRGEKVEKKATPASQEDVEMNGSQLELRVGQIILAEKHPDADRLVAVKVDVGQALPRTVVSGLLKQVPLQHMQNRMVVLLCNLRPAKIRGVLSQAMVMCVTSADKVEILDPPGGAEPGDRVTFLGFLHEPEKELHAKKKEQVLRDLHTDAQCVATYRGAAFYVNGKGLCRAQTLSNCRIK
ncbi:aminoacyl tRNA synthase complex-interacting multifunctional 1 [Solea senegalensis]|uniref:Aminoacyl tRNA synthase complex-interacting multifunctional 1 n=1 Tax=Solea senegalensis TaxID=28829 RepID=A0AAV6T5M2_SOLSE|nr:aminoacyl tRNA synthase complex-interacting multifunctional protein 1-like [Solea senegalensis]KAG7524599.1 aminoacyl tRNA synthase complex-interacting multifunctional 1 [Solea senegalensis]